MMKLVDLLAGVEVLAWRGDRDVEVDEVRDDSRQLMAGDLFVALPGVTVDGHAYVDAAMKRGAKAVVVEREMQATNQVLVPSAAKALARIAANRHGRPADAMKIIGVTGTNGKTTVTHLVEAMLIAAGKRCGVIGTVAYRSPSGTRAAPFTTPTPLLLYALLAEMRGEGCTHIAMECSSHALASDRLEAIDLTVAAFTNLTQDHLDFHGTMSAYAAEKARLFSERLSPAGTAVICVDGPYGAQMARASRAPVIRVGTDADVRPTQRVDWSFGTQVELATPRGPVAFVSPLVGAFNLENLLVAVGIGVALELPVATMEAGLAGARGAPGRLERVGNGRPACFVDYAHTPDALERALAALRPTTRGKLWVLFGCGGDRDRGKRPLMGRIAEAGADRVVLTNDNPRTEDPSQILSEILAACTRDPLVIESRREAIDHVVSLLEPDDVLLVAGKGHEDYQIIGTEKFHFDDREEVLAALQRRPGYEG